MTFLFAHCHSGLEPESRSLCVKGNVVLLLALVLILRGLRVGARNDCFVFVVHVPQKNAFTSIVVAGRINTITHQSETGYYIRVHFIADCKSAFINTSKCPSEHFEERIFVRRTQRNTERHSAKVRW